MGVPRSPRLITVLRRQLNSQERDVQAAAPAAHHSKYWYSFYTRMDFEFDPAKSAANLAKHGIGFVAAQAIWDARTGSRFRRAAWMSRACR